MNKAELYQGMIDELDKKHKELIDNQPVATGNQKEVFESVANRMAVTNSYRIQRERLVKALEEIEGPSPAVAAFIAPQKAPASKFDLDNGTDKIDDSLYPLGGKVL